MFRTSEKCWLIVMTTLIDQLFLFFASQSRPCQSKHRSKKLDQICFDFFEKKWRYWIVQFWVRSCLQKSGKSRWLTYKHRDKTRVHTPAKIFSHLQLLCWLFMGPTPGFDTWKRDCFLIKFGVFHNKNKILTKLFIVNYEKITL